MNCESQMTNDEIRNRAGEGFLHHSAGSLSEKWVARATRPLRSATRRPEVSRATLRKGPVHWLRAFPPFRPASRRTEQAGRLCYPATNFEARSRAFTLVEILITVALLSFIIIGLLMMFSQTQRAFVSSMTQVDVLEGGRDVIDLVTADLANMTPSEQPYTLNFYADTNDLCPNPLIQGLPTVSSVPQVRYNLMQKFFFLTKNNLVWSGVGYQVIPDDANGVVGTLYRYVTNLSVYEAPSLTRYFTNGNYNFANQNVFVSSNKIADGIVHFRVRAFATNGFPFTADRFNNAWFQSSGVTSWTSNEMNNAYAAQWGSGTPYAPYSSVREPLGYRFSSNAMPAELEIEVGILEPQILKTYQGMAAGVAAPQLQYLSNHTANVHLFRQRVHLANVDPYAY